MQQRHAIPNVVSSAIATPILALSNAKLRQNVSPVKPSKRTAWLVEGSLTDISGAQAQHHVNPDL